LCKTVRYKSPASRVMLAKSLYQEKQCMASAVDTGLTNCCKHANIRQQ